MQDDTCGFYIGLMSGTSLDGIDAVGVRFSSKTDANNHEYVRMYDLVTAHRPMPNHLRERFRQLNTSGSNELHLAALASNELAVCYAQAVQEVCLKAKLQPSEVMAIGAHGQTVRHQPNAVNNDFYTRYSIQLNNPALLAELSKITVVADFRRRDIAAGGQGAPLVPAFHRALFSADHADLAVLNLGGIANLSLIHADGSTLGFDCGPANTLLDTWCKQHLGQDYDADGNWAASGCVDEALLQRLLQEPYFLAPIPKSTGLEKFNLSWLQDFLEHRHYLAQDIQATLAELTARTCAQDILRYGQGVTKVGVCGGGAYNADLMQRLTKFLQPHVQVLSTQEIGIQPEHIEAAAFAWLARQCLLGKAGNLTSVTQALGERILGAIYPR